MQFSGIFLELIRVAAELADLDEPGEQKLADLTERCVSLLEVADDAAVSLLPPGFRDVARWLIDNPGVDSWEREIAKSIAEAAYQAWRALFELLGRDQAKAVLG